MLADDGFKSETLFLAVNLMDRVLAVKAVAEERLRLVGLFCDIVGLFCHIVGLFLH